MNSLDNCTYSMNRPTNILRYCLALAAGVLLYLTSGATMACAQDRDSMLVYVPSGRQVERAILLGIGHSSQLDTYLSPMEYGGPQLSFLTVRQRMTGLAGGRVSFQSLVQGAFSRTENPAATADELAGRIGYDAGWHYVWRPVGGLSVRGGALVGADVGFLYNTRNGNNPAQARASADLSLSAAGSWTFRLRRLPMQVLYQADLPVLGCMFSPRYGQSYYEIYQGERDHNVRFTSPANALSLRQMLGFDFCFRRITLRVGYLSDVRQNHLNGIKAHDISRSFMLGYVRHFQTLKRKR